MTVKDFVNRQLEDLDHPLAPQQGKGFFKKNRFRVIIINEDMSFREFYMKYPKSYVFDIKNRCYILVPSAIIRGKYPTCIYYFNNPFPIKFIFEYSKINALDLRDDPDLLESLSKEQKTLLANIELDAEAINLAFNTRVMRGFYANSMLTPKFWIILIIVISIVILIILQASGVVDIWGALAGGQKK